MGKETRIIGQGIAGTGTGHEIVSKQEIINSADDYGVIINKERIASIGDGIATRT